MVDVVGDMPAEGDVYRFTKEVWLTPEQAGLTAEEVTLTTAAAATSPLRRCPSRDRTSGPS